MFHITQEGVRLGQFGHCFSRHAHLLRQLRQDVEQFALLQVDITTAADQLERLSDELHLTDATCAQLDVVIQPLAPHLAVDHRLHVAQGLEGAEIDVLSINEGTQQLHQFLPGLLVTGHHPRLDHGVALPVPPLILVVVFDGGKAASQRASRAEGTQTHVDAEHKTVDGQVVQRLDQFLPQPDEEVLVVQILALAIGFAVGGEGKDQVDVR